MEYYEVVLPFKRMRIITYTYNLTSDCLSYLHVPYVLAPKLESPGLVNFYLINPSIIIIFTSAYHVFFKGVQIVSMS